MKNFKTHLYYYLENEGKCREDLALLKEKGVKVRLFLRSTTTRRRIGDNIPEVPVHELRISGEIEVPLGRHLQNDDYDATWENE